MDANQRKRKQRKLEYNKKWIKASRALNRRIPSEIRLSSSDNESPSPPPTPVTGPSMCSTSFDFSRNVNQNDLDEHEENNTSGSGRETSEEIYHNTWNWDMIDDPGDYIESDSEIENEYEEPLCDDLAGWVNECQIKHNAVDKLLKILQKHGHSDIPSTARTLLKTKRSVITEVKSGMSYLYYCLSDQLINVIDKYPPQVKDNITDLEISLNIDGLPLFKSSSKTVWPVLCAVHLAPLRIFPVALTYGQTKPDNLDFLQDTITDLNIILHNGLQYNGINIEIKLRCIVCDAPAKCMVKAIKLYSGYFGCDRCEQKGNWFGRMTYQETENLRIRTNDSFRRQTNVEHHHRVSPFCDVDMDMVAQFPIDYMHQCCLGVMKRLILIWLRGKKEVKMSALHSEQVSNRLLGLQRFIPREFARKPRSLCEIERWKATEYRQFLLYTGKIVLKGILRDDLYLHFLTFSVAICILVSKNLVQRYHQYANTLLKYFVEMGRHLYGPEFIVYNVHSMLHITSDALKFGSLDAFSAFPFENFMQEIKRMVRSGKNPLAQIAKRLQEMENFKQTVHHVTEYDVSTKRPNNCYVMSNSSCCEVVNTTNIDDGNNRKQLMCRVYERIEPYSNQPCDFGIIGAYKGNDRQSRMKMISPGLLKRKAIMIEKENGNKIFLSLLHF